MILPADQFRKALKRLSAVQSEVFIFHAGFLYASDQELTIRTSFPNLGEFSVASKTLSQIAGKLQKEVTLSLDSNKLSIKSGRAKYGLNTASAVPPNFPATERPFKAPLAELKLALQYASGATEDKLKYSYQGSILLSGKRTVATDGFRLAIFGTSFDSPRLLVPSRAAQAVQGLEGELVMVSENENSLLFETEEAALLTRKLAKDFVNFDSHIPKDLPFSTSFSGEDMRDALRRVSPTSTQADGGAARVNLTFDNGQCVLSTADAAGTASDAIDCKAEHDDPFGESVSLVANLDHLSDFMSASKGPVHFGSNQKVVMLRNDKKEMVLMTWTKR